ncbi:hypothetical protein BSLG_005337 [Batrachochytrium salamandrivorans]|nr:hypothetical protein BSLG_005337 [Batrachochytrium salamandrivorans]
MATFKSVQPLSVTATAVGVAISTPNSISNILARLPPPAPFSALSNVSFDVVPGQVIAIMGSSGSGKTTLMQLLAGRIQNAKFTGNILFNGQSPQQFYSNGSVGYVQQNDQLMPYLTVHETLRYCAELRFPASVPHAEKLELVDQVILELGLKECADTIIGDDWRKGISGGEKRRVSVACQLLLNPSVLFMDEPTTGLDAFTSFNLIETLVNLSRAGRTIFITIHQPRSDIFKLFDSIILLAKGRAIYAGQGGQRMLDYFGKLGHPSPVHVNPADFLIDMCSVDTRNSDDEKRTMATVNRLIDEWDSLVIEKKHTAFAFTPQNHVSGKDDPPRDVGRVGDQCQSQHYAPTTDLAASENHTNTAVIHVQMKPKKTLNQSLGYQKKQRPGAGGLSQCMILTRRAWTNLLRDNLSLWGSLLETVFVALIFGAIFFQLQDNLSGVLSRRGAVYISASIQTYLMLIFVIYKLTNDMKVLDRERSDHMYSVVPYVFGQFFSQLPFNLLFPFIYSVIMYFMMGLRTDSLALHFGRFAIANILGHLVIVAYSLFCVSIARDFATASLIGNAMFTFFSFSTGYFVQLEAIPVYIRWISKISFLTYQFRMMASNEFSDNVYACADVGKPCNGNDILKTLAISVNDFSDPVIALCTIFFVFMVASIAVLLAVKVEMGKHAGVVKSSIKVSLEKHSIVDSERGGPAENGNAHPGHQNQSVNVRIEGLRLELVTRSVLPTAPATRKVLLDDITAEFKENALTIIMGGSGTGKSTLLSVLTARRLRVSTLSKVVQTGKVLFNGNVESDPALISSVCSFVQQSDAHLLPALTCRETLYYGALLRLPPDWTKEQKKERAEEILMLLGLSHCANTVVGNELVKGLSGGEKRRLSIGVQILTNPNVLLIDEPTSGLDAFTAHHIMVTLKKLAQLGRTIICSIHQPRSDIFAMFDSVVLLARGGRVAYSGPARQIIPYFANLGHLLPELTNPADFVLDLSSIDLRNLEAERTTRARVDLLVTVWRDHSANGSVGVDDPPSVDTNNDSNGHMTLYPETPPHTATSRSTFKIQPRLPTRFSTAFPILVIRSLVNTQRQPLIMIARILQVLFLGLIQAMYVPQQPRTQTSVQNRLGVIQQTVSILFIGLLNCVAIFPSERDLMYREYADGAYTLAPFFLAYNFIEIPLEIISAVLFTVFAMVVVGLNTTFMTFMCMVFVVFCFVNIGESVGIGFCSVVDHVGFSVSLTNSVLGIFVVMSGILSSNMPIVLDRLNYMSPIPYLTRLLTINEFDHTTVFSCTQDEIASNTCLYHTGADVLALLSGSVDVMPFEGGRFAYYALIGGALTVMYRVIAYAILQWKVHQ